MRRLVVELLLTDDEYGDIDYVDGKPKLCAIRPGMMHREIPGERVSVLADGQVEGRFGVESWTVEDGEHRRLKWFDTEMDQHRHARAALENFHNVRYVINPVAGAPEVPE